MSKKSSVSVQKGPIKADVKTMKTMTYAEKLAERAEQLRELRDGQTLKELKPKR